MSSTKQAAGAGGQTTDAQDVGTELNNLETSTRPPLPIENDIMQLARLGEIDAIRKLFDSGKFTADYADEEGITALHWAAINNHYALCKFLLQSGAKVDAKGGESVATPAMWAAQRCHYYVVHLLLEHGADPLLTDAQGYNILHLATIDGNAYLLVLLLHQEIPVDVVDPQGHTSLMWAAYKGFPTLVDLLLRWGASIHARDEGGLTPLHWALVRGSPACIQKMIEYGADRYAETNDGKTPSMVASEMNSTKHWHRALGECGFDPHGRQKKYPILRNKRFMSGFFFLLPSIYLLFVIDVLSRTKIYVGLPLVAFSAILMQVGMRYVASLGPPEYRNLHRTPYMAGVFAASLLWVGLRWLTTVMPTTYSTHLFVNILFFVMYTLIAYFYFLAMFEDPGFVPKIASRNQQRKTVEELFSLWKFDEENFCIHCLSRRPLRSKHCRRCARCVAKHDHHCPWLHNCVGSNNLRHFVVYVFTLELGILLFLRLAIWHIELLPASTTSAEMCTILPFDLCSYYLKDPFTIILGLWSALQLVWVTMIAIVQPIQISRNQTTYENMRGSNGYESSFTTALATGATDIDMGGAGPNPATASLGGLPAPATAGGQRGKKPTGCCTSLTTLIGLDTFVKTARGSRGGASRRRPKNPWNQGVVRNCRDFWCDGMPYFGDRSRSSAAYGTSGFLAKPAGSDDGVDGGSAGDLGSVGIGMLGGQQVDWTRLWDIPRGGTIGVNSGMQYRRLVGAEGGDDDDEEDNLTLGRGGRGEGLLAGGGSA